MFSSILRATAQQVKNQGKFKVLNNKTVILNNMRQDDIKLIEDAQTNDKLLYNLKLQVVNDRLKLLKDIKRINKDIESQKVVCDDYICIENN